MMITRIKVTLMVAAVVIGCAAGAAFPQRSANAVTGEVRINPGGNWGWLTTSWHGLAGNALDWGRYGGGAEGHNVAWRSWSYRSDTSSPAALGTISAYTYNLDCTNVQAAYYDNSSSLVGTSNYMHTLKIGSTGFTIYGDNGWEYQNVVISKYATDDEEYCSEWYGAHVHQFASSGFTTAYGSFLTTYTDYAITDNGVYQARKQMAW